MGVLTIKVPDVGEGIAEAELAEWNVSVGDQVQEDDVFAAVMTDKATVEIPSGVNGKVVWLGAGVLAQLEIVRTGQGKGVLADFLAQRYPEMIPTEPERPPLEHTFWLRVHEDLADLIRVRKTIDYLVGMCRSERKAFAPTNVCSREPQLA